MNFKLSRLIEIPSKTITLKDDTFFQIICNWFTSNKNNYIFLLYKTALNNVKSIIIFSMILYIPECYE